MLESKVEFSTPSGLISTSLTLIFTLSKRGSADETSSSTALHGFVAGRMLDGRRERSLADANQYQDGLVTNRAHGEQ
jgi:hypothetical protein